MVFTLKRHCAERLPHGIPVWVEAARRAGFDGTLYVRGFRPRDAQPHGRILLGTQFGSRIVIRLNAPCGKTKSKVGDPLVVFAHELGHWDLQRRGLKNTNGIDFRSNSEQAMDSIERRCDRYAKRLLKGLL